MSEKIAKTGIKRDNDLMYYIKGGDVWAVPRKKPGQPKGKATKVAAPGIELDYSKYLYFVDGDGDVARKARQVGGSASPALPHVPLGRDARPPHQAAPRAAVRRARRDHHAHRDDIRRRLADHPVPLDALHLRRLPRLHGLEDVPAPQLGDGPLDQPRAPTGAPLGAEQWQVAMQTGNGLSAVISSDTAPQEPNVSFLVQLIWPGNIRVQQVTAVLLPAVASAAEPVMVAPTLAAVIPAR